MNNSEICIIRAKLKKDYVYDAIANYGYHIFTPYKGKTLFFRILREIWFRCRLPYRELWFKKTNVGTNIKTIIMFDPLISPEYIEWIHKYNPQSKIILSYENRADKTIRPDKVPSYVEKWSYDQDDCKKYSMKWSAPSFFMEYRRERKCNPKYDVLYVGRDKGRAGALLRLEKEMKKRGLKTYFHICADRQYLRFRKKYYKRLLTYDEYMELLVDSRAVLNIVPKGQKSITQREMEAIFDGIKCITNNLGVRDFEMFDKSIFFVLGEDEISNISEFLNTEVKIFNEDTLKKYDFNCKIQQMIYG